MSTINEKINFLSTIKTGNTQVSAEYHSRFGHHSSESAGSAFWSHQNLMCPCFFLQFPYSQRSWLSDASCTSPWKCIYTILHEVRKRPVTQESIFFIGIVETNYFSHRNTNPFSLRPSNRPLFQKDGRSAPTIPGETKDPADSGSFPLQRQRA